MKMHSTDTKWPTGNHKEINDDKKYSVNQTTNIRIQIYFEKIIEGNNKCKEKTQVLLVNKNIKAEI